MNQELKAGDLCVIIACQWSDENLFKTVTLIEFIEANQKIILHGVTCHTDKTAAWVVKGNDLLMITPIGVQVRGEYAGYSSRRLRKISPDDKQFTKTKEQELVH